VKDRPEPLVRLDLLFEAARIVHEASFDLHGELAALGAADDFSRDLLRKSAHIALTDLVALTAPARELAALWDEQALLARGDAERASQAFRAEMERIAPELERLRARQDLIARELRSRVVEARES
jgi:hypothetical protein